MLETGRHDENPLPVSSISPAELPPDRQPLSSDYGSKFASQRQLSTIVNAAHLETIVQKLLVVGRDDLAEPLTHCHTEETICRCRGCGKVKVFLNHCDRFYCPVCQPGLTRKRMRAIEWWAKVVKQPKHVVLTCRNTDSLTKTHVETIKLAFRKLRRSKFAKNWLGGCWSLECTNESKGWHLHLHALIDARFIDQRELSIAWGKLVGQDYAIVWVKDCRQSDYLHEITKYTVKGSELADWYPHEIVAFIEAFDHVRSFGTFGTLYDRNSEWRAFVEAQAEALARCPCGCMDVDYFTPDAFEWFKLKAGGLTTDPPDRNHIPEPIATRQQSFSL